MAVDEEEVSLDRFERDIDQFVELSELKGVGTTFIVWAR